MEEKQRDILQRIQGISKVDQVGLSQEFFFKLIDSMDAQRFWVMEETQWMRTVPYTVDTS